MTDSQTSAFFHSDPDDPKLTQLIEAMRVAVANSSDYFERCDHNLNVRYTWWEGQTRDGRKWDREHEKAFPWNGASDVRIRAVEMVIREKVDLLMTTLARMNIQTIPTNAGNSELGGRMSALLRWYLSNAMADEIDSELEPLMHYLFTYGAAVAGIHWKQTTSYENFTITLQDMEQMAMQAGGPQGPQLVAALGTMLFDPAREEQMLQYIQSVSPLLGKARARKVLRDLQTNASATFPRPYVAESRPTLSALQVFIDVLFPAGTVRLQEALWIAQRELLSEPDLRERAAGAEGWDEAWVDQVIETQRGKLWNSSQMAVQLMDRQREMGSAWGPIRDDEEGLFEVWHFYRRLTDDDSGLPALWRTVFHPGVPELYGKHGLHEYDHGQYPYVEFLNERVSRSILAARGLPELLDTEQDAIKIQTDSRTDRASITTLPPVKEKLRRGGIKTTFGPGVVLPVQNMDDIEAMELSGQANDSIEVEQRTWWRINMFVGRMGEGIDPGLVQRADAATVNRFLRRFTAAGRQMGQLAQQYTPPVIIPRIVGQISQPWEVDRASIAGQFDLILSFDPRMADQDYLFQLMERLEQYVLPVDTNATVDRDVLIKWLMYGIDPTLADMAVKDSQAAQIGEIEDEQGNLAKMFSGVEPPMKLKGQNFAARLQVLQGAMQNPRLQSMAQQWPDFAQMLQRRAEFLQQQVTQQGNKQIGAYGTTPSAATTGGTSGGPAQPQGNPVPMLGAIGQS